MEDEYKPKVTERIHCLVSSNCFKASNDRLYIDLKPCYINSIGSTIFIQCRYNTQKKVQTEAEWPGLEKA